MKICYFSFLFAFVFSFHAQAQSKIDITDIPGYLEFQFNNASDPISLDDFPYGIKPDFNLTCSLWWSNSWTNLNMAKHPLTSGRGYKPMGPLFPENPPVETLALGLVFANGNNSKDTFDNIVANSTTTSKDREIIFKYASQTTTLRKAGPYIFFKYDATQIAHGYCWREKDQ